LVVVMAVARAIFVAAVFALASGLVACGNSGDGSWVGVGSSSGGGASSTGGSGGSSGGASSSSASGGVSSGSGSGTSSSGATASDGGGSGSSSGSPDAATTSDAGPGPIDLPSATIYSVYVPIFSAAGRLADVTAQIPRIRALGFSALYLLPVTPIGQAVNGHPSYGSPYSVHDYQAIDPGIGTAQDLVSLVSAAHAAGMQVLLDEVLNHTAWDNALVTQHPDYYLHSDGNRTNPASIAIAGNGAFPDSAQLDYKTMPDVGLRQYMSDMLLSVVRTYDVDGFRFDTADDPYGAGRLIPADFWQGLRPQLEAAKPGFLMLGEEEDPELADAPFELDYGWHLQGKYGMGGLQQVATGGAASLLQQAWQFESTGWPAGMKYMALLQDWDFDEDVKLYGGVPNTLAAATFNFTMDGVPLLFNGEEVGNDNSAFNTHTPIDWNSPNAAAFQPFYASLLALRSGSSTLQGGAVTWIANTAPAHVVTYTRSDANGTYLVAINFSGASVSGTVSSPAASGWTDVSPVGSPGGTAHAAPPALMLGAFDFEVFRAR
jgi:glycosidase